MRTASEIILVKVKEGERMQSKYSSTSSRVDSDDSQVEGTISQTFYVAGTGIIEDIYYKYFIGDTPFSTSYCHHQQLRKKDEISWRQNDDNMVNKDIMVSESAE
ncbi:hypothetical protein LOAG_09153 [Loa loa]|uniref:Uncharacterized protein n=1 Tax=Loa loa TaxID=7209 RepID=A0A1S0TTV8_LOALO|nr:hypothetical protein LOAG_09153 [Loa loa]EFO19342.1 hypothetical protein LOAG_09153 [Loa loa]